MKKEILNSLDALIKEIQAKEDECYRQMAYMNEHKFEMEREAIRYRQQAYNLCWLMVASKRDEVKKILDEGGQQ